jgi:hypothetical protein
LSFVDHGSYFPFSILTSQFLHPPFSIPNFSARRVRRRAPVVSGARNAMSALGLTRVRRFFARFKNPLYFQRSNLPDRRLPLDRRLPACNERDSANIFLAEARTRVRAKHSR